MSEMSGDEEGRGGDPACWLERVCDRCGALIEDDGDDHTCRTPAEPAR